MNVIEKVFGTHSERELKMIRPIVAKIESMRTDMMAKSDEELRDQTRILKERLAGGETLDDILPEAFATVREAAKRTLNMEHFPVQLIGGIVLHQGRIAEMRTGEGKTLVSTCPAYLNALGGKGVQIEDFAFIRELGANALRSPAGGRALCSASGKGRICLWS